MEGTDYDNSIVDASDLGACPGVVTDRQNNSFSAEEDSLGHWGPGRKGNAIYFGGGIGDTTGKYAVISSGYMLNGVNQMTWALWIKTTGTGNPQAAFINHGNFWIQAEGNRGMIQMNTISGSIGDSTYWSQFAWDGVWNDDTWHHLTMVYDSGAGITLYKDGVVQQNFPEVTGTIIQSFENVRLGTSHEEWGFFKGWMDEVRFYDRALSQSEIQELIALDTGVGGVSVKPLASVSKIYNANTVKSFAVYNARGVMIEKISSIAGIGLDKRLFSRGVYFVKPLGVEEKVESRRVVIMK